MAQITAALVKQLRDKTGAGMMDAKKALVENDGDVEAAIDWLRAKGLSKAAKKSGKKVKYKKKTAKKKTKKKTRKKATY